MVGLACPTCTSPPLHVQGPPWAYAMEGNRGPLVPSFGGGGTFCSQGKIWQNWAQNSTPSRAKVMTNNISF